jgi:hypothetical protein
MGQDDAIETPSIGGLNPHQYGVSKVQNQRAQAVASFLTNGDQKANCQMANGILRRHAIL